MKEIKKADFSRLISKAKGRAKKAKNDERKQVTIDKEYLFDLWNKQNACCPYCKMKLDIKGKTHQPGITPDMRATLDRIDSSKGYIKGNIAIVHMVCNRFKGQLPYALMYAIARRIVDCFETAYPQTKVEV